MDNSSKKNVYVFLDFDVDNSEKVHDECIEMFPLTYTLDEAAYKKGLVHTYGLV